VNEELPGFSSTIIAHLSRHWASSIRSLSDMASCFFSICLNAHASRVGKSTLAFSCLDDMKPANGPRKLISCSYEWKSPVLLLSYTTHSPSSLLPLALQVVGDDMLVTNPTRVKRGIEQKAVNSLLLKVNQIGTLTESIEAVRMSKEAGWGVMTSHRYSILGEVTFS